jgi:nitroreductase
LIKVPSTRTSGAKVLSEALSSEFSAGEIDLFDQVVKSRRSVRGFLHKRVPEHILKQVFETAGWAPSGTNVQPWYTCVASGEVRDNLRASFLDRKANKIKPVYDHQSDGKTGDPWRERKRACARALYGAMGIEWEDKEGRGRAAMRNYELFDAPHVAFLCMDEVFGIQSACDVGMYAQTLMLAMAAHGIGSCAQGTMRDYPDLVRDAFDLEPSVKVLFGISFGYEDVTTPANAARTDRASLVDTVSFKG